MKQKKSSFVIVLAEGDPNKRREIMAALSASELSFGLWCVSDDQELRDYLFRRGKYESPSGSPRPDLVLLGEGLGEEQRHVALRTIKSNLVLRLTPVVDLCAPEVRAAPTLASYLEEALAGAGQFGRESATDDLAGLCDPVADEGWPETPFPG